MPEAVAPGLGSQRRFFIPWSFVFSDALDECHDACQTEGKLGRHSKDWLNMFMASESLVTKVPLGRCPASALLSGCLTRRRHNPWQQP